MVSSVAPVVPDGYPSLDNPALGPRDCTHCETAGPISSMPGPALFHSLSSSGSEGRFFLPEQPSGFWIDQVHPCAGRTIDGLIEIDFVVGWITLDPALHVQTSARATVHKYYSHNALNSAGDSIIL